MKNKGFTLVELIITITLIAIISVTIGVSMSGMLSRQEDNKLEEYITDIEEAACTYAELHDNSSNDTVKIDTLIQEGYLSTELTHPINEDSITNYANDEVEIVWEDGKRSCNYEIKIDWKYIFKFK